MTDQDLIASLYDPIEQTILYEYFGIPSPQPLWTVYLDDVGVTPHGVDPRGRIRLCEGLRNGLEFALGNAVARLVLSDVQGRLPQRAAADADFQAHLARPYRRSRQGLLHVLPTFLCSIDWAVTGPGYSWPEAYHLAYVAGFDRYVVTASAACAESYDYPDIVVEHFGPLSGLDLLHRAKETIVNHWRHQFDRCVSRWTEFVQAGEIDEATAQTMADAVWGNGEEEDLREEDGGAGIAGPGVVGDRP